MGKLIPAKERVWVSAQTKGKYESLAGKGPRKGKGEKIFKTQAALFDLCTAIGLRDGQSSEIRKRVELVQSYSIDKNDALALVLLSKEPELEDEQILRRLEEYAEYGIDKVHSWITRVGAKNIGDLSFVNWLKLEQDLQGKETPHGIARSSS